MIKRAKVKEVLESYNEGGIVNVQLYLNQENLIIDPSTWANKIKTLLENNQQLSASAEIELIITEFKI